MGMHISGERATRWRSAEQERSARRFVQRNAKNMLRIHRPEQSAEPLPLKQAAGAESMSHPGRGDHRTPSPVVSPVLLSDLLNAFYARSADAKTESSWSGYRTLVRYWETHHKGPGPDVRSLSVDDLQDFFASVNVWRSRRSWVKNRDLLFALLKSGCRRTLDNKKGSDNPELQTDQLPVWDPPRDRWFRDRDDQLPPVAQRGGHRKRKLSVMTADEFGSVLDAVRHSDADFLTPAWWYPFFGLLWFAGPRIEDMWRYRWEEGRLCVSVDRRVIEFTETKAGGESVVPLPSWLVSQFARLRQSQQANAGDLVFANVAGGEPTPHRLAAGHVQNSSRKFRPAYKRIWTDAGVPLRHPHEMRAQCISLWFKHAPKYRFAATGHQPPKSDVQASNYLIFDDDFRDAAESFPAPDAVVLDARQRRLF